MTADVVTEAEERRTPLSRLGLDRRVLGALHRGGYRSVEQLRAVSDERLAVTRNIGSKSIAQIRHAIKALQWQSEAR